MTDKKQIVTRFAPSPTGFLHIGGARSALFNYFFTRQNNGKIILRIEDTDKERSKPEYTEGIIKAFEWLNLKFDEVVKQTDNLAVHQKYLKKLLDSGHIYISKEEVVEEGQRAEVIRFKNPNKEIIFDDLIKGQVKFDTTELGDFVVAKSMEEPIFHLANVVDDITMGVTHVIRGEEHISNTPRQILIWEAIDEKPRPIYGHIPLILSETREKISKRKHGEIVKIEHYQEKGYLPEAIINFLAFLGWNPGGEEEIFSLEELVKKFDIHKVQKGGAVFNPEKLNWFNREYIKRLSKEERIKNYKKELEKAGIKTDDKNILEKIEPVITERISKWSDVGEMIEKGEINFIFGKPVYRKESFLWKGKGNYPKTTETLNKVKEILSSIKEKDFNAIKIKEVLWPFAEEVGKGEVLWPFRYSLSGLEKSPDPFVIAEILSKNESILRLDEAVKLLNE